MASTAATTIAATASAAPVALVDCLGATHIVVAPRAQNTQPLTGAALPTDLHRAANDVVSAFLCENWVRSNNAASAANPISGWSLWRPHAIPDSIRPSKSRLLDATSLPQALRIVYDRTYTATTLAGKTLSFEHFLLTSAGVQNEADLLAAGAATVGRTTPCLFEETAGNDSCRSLHFDDFDTAVNSGYGIQLVLKRCIDDDSASLADRVDAAILYVWIGSNDIPVEDLRAESCFAASFVTTCFQKYPPLAEWSAESRYWFDVSRLCLSTTNDSG